MKTYRKPLVVAAVVFVVCLCWLFVGIRVDPEFGEYSPFLKPWPTTKMVFRSPIGMTDRTLCDLTPEQQYEQVMYDVYVDNSLGSIFGPRR